MRKFLFAVLFASVCAYEAAAADPKIVGEFIGAPSAYDWGGAYLGVHGGYVQASGDWNFDPAFALGTSASRFGGALVGVHGGAQHQFENNFVLGLEADIQRQFVTDSAAIESFGLIIPITLDASLNWVGSARVRAGYAMSRWMPFVTGGVAIADFDVIGSIVPFLVSAPHSDLAVGWTVGAGIEYALTDNVLVRSEYRYSDFGSGDRSALGVPDAYQLSTHQIAFGISYKF